MVLAAERISDTIYMIGNEPTLACYRIQEHVHKSGPILIDKGVSMQLPKEKFYESIIEYVSLKYLYNIVTIIDPQSEMKRLQRNLQGCTYGVDYSIKAIKGMKESLIHLQNIHELLKNALFMKQQLNYEESIKARVRAKQAAGGSGSTPNSNLPSHSPSTRRTPFQRFSGSFDIPTTLITSSLSGISSSASADLKELKASLSGQLKPSPSSAVSSVHSVQSTSVEPSTSANMTQEHETEHAQETKGVPN